MGLKLIYSHQSLQGLPFQCPKMTNLQLNSIQYQYFILVNLHLYGCNALLQVTTSFIDKMIQILIVTAGPMDVPSVDF